MGVEEVCLPNRLVGRARDTVELEIDRGHTGVGETLGVALLVSEGNPVRVHLDVFESHLSRTFDEFGQLVVDGRFTA